ncbi:MAG: hypothetical protein JST54_10790 [Deltaproteobacteria bacterium]|nr:hypothetical protein [Deltaproteobacteria bacterium]
MTTHVLLLASTLTLFASCAPSSAPGACSFPMSNPDVPARAEGGPCDGGCDPGLTCQGNAGCVDCGHTGKPCCRGQDSNYCLGVGPTGAPTIDATCTDDCRCP